MMHAYIRCSTEEQTRGATLQEQERTCRGMAMAKGIAQYDLAVYVDAGVSGSKPLRWRPEGFRMWEAVQAKDVVVAAKLDRLFRDAHDAQNVYKHWKDMGVDLILYDLGTEPVTQDGMGKFFFIMLSAFADLERGRIRERILEGKRAKERDGGLTGNPPIGFRQSGRRRDAIAVLDAREQDMLVDLRRMGSDVPPSQALKKLNAEGYLSRAGKPYCLTQVKRMLAKVHAPGSELGMREAYREAREF